MIIRISIECGNKPCGSCRFHKRVLHVGREAEKSVSGYCDLFKTSLYFERCDPCIRAAALPDTETALTEQRDALAEVVKVLLSEPDGQEKFEEWEEWNDKLLPDAISNARQKGCAI